MAYKENKDKQDDKDTTLPDDEYMTLEEFIKEFNVPPEDVYKVKLFDIDDLASGIKPRRDR